MSGQRTPTTGTRFIPTWSSRGSRPGQLIVSDITYIPYWMWPETDESDFCYLSLVTDYCTREIIGYSVGDTLEARYVLEALEMAVDFYNNERPHLSLDGMTPSEASGLSGTIWKRWRSYREAAIRRLATPAVPRGELFGGLVPPAVRQTTAVVFSSLPWGIRNLCLFLPMSRKSRPIFS